MNFKYCDVIVYKFHLKKTRPKYSFQELVEILIPFIIKILNKKTFLVFHFCDVIWCLKFQYIVLGRYHKNILLNMYLSKILWF